jgi:short-subunit dehydrogenase
LTGDIAKVALVSGATRGIGLGIAEMLARQGYALTVTARDAARLDTVAADLRAAGAAEIVSVAADMADTEGVERVLAQHADRFGAMSALILNAGVGTAGALAESSMRRFDKTLAVNLRAPLQLIQGALPMLRAGAAAAPARGAKVIALSSITGVYAEAGLSVYGAAKAALISLIATLNAEESANGVTATTIAPGYVDTEMSAWIHDRIPPERMLAVDDVVGMVDALLRLSSRAVVPNIVMSRAGTDGYRA